jgi:hypothetical protein
MTLTIQLPHDDEARLAMKAKEAGVDLPTYVERLLKADVSRPPIEEILQPVQDAFDQSGMSEDDLSNLLVQAKKDMREDRQLGRRRTAY